MGNDNMDVGTRSPRKTAKPIVEHMQSIGASGAGTVKQMMAGQPAKCGAMSQQGSFSYHGNVSSPQQLLHLVGCCDSMARPESRTRKALQQR
ncbi:MAG: hypothetical protein U1E61_19705 [Bradyrhizobium sp.]